MGTKQKFPGGSEGKELRKALGQDEPVLAYASGKGGSLLVATDRRAIIIKTGASATGQWFGKKVASYGYQQIASVDLHTGFADGYVQIAEGGVQQHGRIGRYAQLVHADNICPFNKGSEGAFRHVVDTIRQHLYAASPQSQQAQQSIPDQVGALAQLHEQGILSDAEFEAKKAELLSRM
jgi:hypothetical protein